MNSLQVLRTVTFNTKQLRFTEWKIDPTHVSALKTILLLLNTNTHFFLPSPPPSSSVATTKAIPIVGNLNVSITCRSN